MPRLLSLLATALFAGITFAQSTIDVNGQSYPVDTLEHYQVGPGTTYTRFDVRMGSTNHHLYLLTVDLENPYVKLEEEQGGDRMGATETLVSVSQRIDSLGHRPIGGVNCNFWIVSSQAVGTSEGLLGVPFAGTAKDGMLLGEPEGWNAGHGDRGFVMIDDMQRAFIRNLSYKGRVVKGSKSAAIRDVNRNRVNPNDNEIALFNRYCGATTRAIPDSAIEVIFDAPQGWAVNDSMTCVVTAVNHTGGTALTNNMGAFQARGARGNWCATNLAVGDTFAIYLGVYATSLTPDDDYSADSLAPHVMQMVTGNCLVMANGVLTSRNTNEQYNNQNYPRTMLATNNEGTRFWMLVSEKPGNYTAEMCAILRNDGATWAAGMDGGGSAQFNLFGATLNPTTEGTPRAVANSLFVINRAPESSEVARIEQVSTAAQQVDAYATYTPSLRFYNPYGTLLPAHTTPYTLSLAPASLGTIAADGRSFTAGPVAGEGVLTVTSGEATLSFPVSVEAGELHLRLDSVLTDHRPYTLEVLTGEAVVPADVLVWESADESIVQVENGVITGIANGETVVRGVLGESHLEQPVKVEIPQDSLYLWREYVSLLAPSLGTEALLDASKGFEPTLSLSEDSAVTRLDFTFAVTRSAYVRFTPQLPLYALPDSLILMLRTDALVKNMRVYGRGNMAASKATFTSSVLPDTAWTRIAVPVSAWTDVTDRASYPVWFEGFELQLDSKTAAGDRYVEWQTPLLRYADYVLPEPDALDEIDAFDITSSFGSDSSVPTKFWHNGHLYILYHSHLYTPLGLSLR